MAPPTAQRVQNAYSFAVQLVLDKWSYNAAIAETSRLKRLTVTRATLHRRVQQQKTSLPTPRKSGRRLVLGPQQEKEIVGTCKYFAIRGIPIFYDELANLVQSAYGSIPSVRARFKNGRPGKEWLRSFCKRHAMKFNAPSPQEAERHACTSATTLVHHMLQVGDAITKFNIDATRLSNLDETSMPPGNDTHGVSRKRQSRHLNIVVVFKQHVFDSNLNRVTLLGTINAAESIASVLPPGSILGTRADIGGVNQAVFVRWCKSFVLRVQHLTADEKKVLMVYDA
eukprot:IDg1831t1